MSPQPERSQSPPSKDIPQSKSSGSKKRVGRKKTTQDGDAVERRRTQLRLAQRAYRERKETTIADLEKKTANLERALGEMYSIFSGYHDTVAIHQASPNDAKWVQDLDHVRDELNIAMQQAGVDPGSDKVAERRRARASVSPVPPQARFNMDEIRRQRTASSGAGLEPADTLGYPFGATPAIESTIFGKLDDISAQAIEQLDGKDGDRTRSSSERLRQVAVADFIMRDTKSGMAVVYSSNWMNKSQLAGPSGFRNETSSFARRLFHFSMETTFRLLSDPRRSEEEIYRRLRWSLVFRDRHELLQRVISYLHATQREKGNGRPPDPGVFPVGNAGTHYPRPPFIGPYAKRYRVPEQEIELTAEEKTRFPLGLYKFTAVEPGDFPEHVLKHQFPKDLPWFDTHDTEMYLRDRGVKFNALFNTATIDVELEEQPQAYTSTPPAPPPAIEVFNNNNNLLLTPNQPADLTMDDVNFDDIDWAQLGDWSMMQLTEETLPDLSMGSSSVQTSSSDDLSLLAALDAPGAAQFGGFGTVGDELGIGNVLDAQNEVGVRTGTNFAKSRAVVRRKKTLNIDVDALINLLINGAMCLGRAPGFRKNIVDDALDGVIASALQQ